MMLLGRGTASMDPTNGAVAEGCGGLGFERLLPNTLRLDLPVDVIIRSDAHDGCLLGAGILAETVRKKPDAVLGLAAGRSPERLYRELVRMHREDGLDFSRVTTFNLDEYVGLSPTHPQSYHHFMNERLFRHIDIDPSNTHVPDASAEDLAAECRDYERRIASAGGIDVQLLGLGRNGHIGFNEPPASPDSRTGVVTLSEQTLNDNAAVFGDRDAIPRRAVTMGIATIMEARRVVLLAFGPTKVHAVTQMIEGPQAANCPASALQSHPQVTIVLDNASAAGLRSASRHRSIHQNEGSQRRQD